MTGGYENGGDLAGETMPVLHVKLVDLQRCLPKTVAYHEVPAPQMGALDSALCIS